VRYVDPQWPESRGSSQGLSGQVPVNQLSRENGSLHKKTTIPARPNLSQLVWHNCFWSPVIQTVWQVQINSSELSGYFNANNPSPRDWLCVVQRTGQTLRQLHSMPATGAFNRPDTSSYGSTIPFSVGLFLNNKNLAKSGYNLGDSCLEVWHQLVRWFMPRGMTPTC